MYKKKSLNFYRVKEKEERTYTPEEMERMITTTCTTSTQDDDELGTKQVWIIKDRERKQKTQRQKEIDKYIPKAKKRKKK